MNRFLLTVLLGITFLSGCATQPCCTAPMAVATVAPCTASGCAPMVRKILATGYGNPGSFNQYTPGQAKLMAMRAAKVDALRNLAEQVHGVRVWGNTAVSAFVAQNDTIRTYVDSFIRGARVVNMTAIADGNYEATVELELSQNFFDCFASPMQCGNHSAVYGCVGNGCSSPSVTYISN